MRYSPQIAILAALTVLALGLNSSSAAAKTRIVTYAPNGDIHMTI